MHYYVITVRFLDSRFHGRDSTDAPVWPPSPFRIFQAMLAGAANAMPDWEGRFRKTMQFIEGLPPPSILSQVPVECKAVVTYVPSNNRDLQESEEKLKTAKRIQPQMLPAPLLPLSYVWSASSIPPDLTESLCDLPRHIHSLGWGIDMAVGQAQILSEPPAAGQGLELFSPLPCLGNWRLQVPKPGSLDSLINVHAAKSGRVQKRRIHTLIPQKDFAEISYSSSLQRPYCSFELRDPDDESRCISFSPKHIKCLVGMIRRVFHQCKADITRIAPQLDVDGFLFGHGQEADCHRLSILPVHTIGHQYADGRVRRFILAEPIGFDGQISALLKGNLDQEKLVADDPDKTVVAKIFSISAFSKFTHPYYIKPARTWATVSPVLLPGFDRRESKKGATASVVQAQYKRAVGLVHKALRQAGIVAEVKSIELSPLSWWPNLPHARDYVPRDKLGSAPRYHVKITFEQPFYGPFSLGRQRHMGFGVFAVLPDSKEDEDASKCNSYGGRCIND